MPKVRLTVVTDDAVATGLGVLPGVWYPYKRTSSVTNSGYADFPNMCAFVLIDGDCAYLRDNEQTQWEYSPDDMG